MTDLEAKITKLLILNKRIRSELTDEAFEFHVPSLSAAMDYNKFSKQQIELEIDIVKRLKD